MPFNLWTDGVILVDRVVHLFNRVTKARDPLQGIVDGANTLFYASTPPILSSGSIGLWTSGSAPLQSSDYAVDLDAGLFTLVTAPTVQPTSTYQTARFSDYQVKSMLVAGFDEMQGWWTRGLYLSDLVGQSVIVPITEDSGFAYIVNSSGSDPQIGSMYFGDSHTQMNFYAKCVQLAYIRTLMTESALTGITWTEAQGLRVDKTKVAPNLKLAYDVTEKALLKSLNAAMYEFNGSSVWGGAVFSPQTGEMAAHRFWQGRSMAQNGRGTTPYIGHSW